jgi:c-di-GMP-binding flagellar brake protein YcgR
MLKTLFGKKGRTKNTRQYKRFRAAYLVKYQVKGKEEPRITNIVDMSAGGIRFWSPEQLPESSILNLSIYIPPLERSIQAWAQVLRVRRAKEGGLLYYVAVSFVDLKPEDKEAVNQFAETLAKDEGGQFVIDHADVVVRRR